MALPRASVVSVARAGVPVESEPGRGGREQGRGACRPAVVLTSMPGTRVAVKVAPVPVCGGKREGRGAGRWPGLPGTTGRS